MNLIIRSQVVWTVTGLKEKMWSVWLPGWGFSEIALPHSIVAEELVISNRSLLGCGCLIPVYWYLHSCEWWARHIWARQPCLKTCCMRDLAGSHAAAAWLCWQRQSDLRPTTCHRMSCRKKCQPAIRNMGTTAPQGAVFCVMSQFCKMQGQFAWRPGYLTSLGNLPIYYKSISLWTLQVFWCRAGGWLARAADLSGAVLLFSLKVWKSSVVFLTACSCFVAYTSKTLPATNVKKLLSILFL